MTTSEFQMKSAYWSGVIKKQQESGLCISQWCAQNGVSTARYHHWNRVLNGCTNKAPLSRTNYTKEFKEKAIQSYKSRGQKSVKDVAVELGIYPNLLNKWYKDAATLDCEKAQPSPEPAERSSAGSINLQVNGVELELPVDTPLDVMETILKALR